MRGSAVDLDSVGDPEKLLIEVSFKLGPSITGGKSASLEEVRARLQNELANVKQDRFLQLALTFIVDEIQYALEGAGRTPDAFPEIISAAWDLQAEEGLRVYYPPFDDATAISS